MRQFLLALGDHFTHKTLGPSLRRLGFALDRAGVSLSKSSYVEKCKAYSDVRSLRNIPTETSIPDLGRSNFVAPNASIIGQVKLGQNSSVWYGSVLRGDVSSIEIGEDSVIQDLVTIKRAVGSDVIRIGRGVTIAPNAFVGGAVVEDYAYVGMGSVVADGCVIESYSVVAAGANVSKGARIPSGQIWAGSPAKYLRDVTPEERDAIREYHGEMKNLAAIHSEETEKSFEQVFKDDFLKERSYMLSWSESLYEKMETLGLNDHPIDHTEVERVRGWEYASMHERYSTDLYSPKNWRPFKEDAAVFPEDWKIYGEDLESYDRAKKIFDQPPRPRDTSSLPAVNKDESPWLRRF